MLTVFRGATAINDGTTAEPRRSWRCSYGLCRRGRGGGHVRIGKVQHTLAKAVHALGCLYLVIILSNYSRFIMLVKKLQFPP